MIQKHQLTIYNSITGKKERFKSLHPKRIGMYVCGPTVYSNVHLGNVRTFMSFDVIFRYFKHLGYDVRYVRNLTDVGHLLDNEEDKVSSRARLEQIEPMEVVQKYTVDFHNVLNQFNFLTPSIEPCATGHILDQVEITQKLLEKGFAYEIDGSVYFDVIKYNESYNYGELSKRNIEDLISNSRALDGQGEKKNPQDFALWKKAKPEHIMRWKSPWGEGFPGWHLECTVMSTKYLGDEFDIHGGGMDLKFPHHECEIAQAKAANSQNPVRYWMHANMLTLNGQKMSKSTGNSILPHELFSGENDFFSQGFSANTIRFFILQAHYRSVLDLSNEAMLASEKGWGRLAESLKALSHLPVSKQTSFDLEQWIQNCYKALDDDINTPILIAELFEASKKVQAIKIGKETITLKDLERFSKKIHEFVEDILGLKIQEEKIHQDKLDGIIRLLIEMRDVARSNKNWELSDQIRDRLMSLGIQLKDHKDGTDFTY